MSVNYTHTYCQLGDEELDVKVYFDSSPEERDVNWGGSFDVEQVIYKGKDITGQLTNAELEELTERVYQDLCDANDPDNRADYEYERRLDRED